MFNDMSEFPQDYFFSSVFIFVYMSDKNQKQINLMIFSEVIHPLVHFYKLELNNTLSVFSYWFKFLIDSLLLFYWILSSFSFIFDYISDIIWHDPSKAIFTF